MFQIDLFKYVSYKLFFIFILFYQVCVHLLFSVQ